MRGFRAPILALGLLMSALQPVFADTLQEQTRLIPQAQDPVIETRNGIQSAIQHYRAGDLNGAERALRPIMPDLVEVPPQQRYTAYSLLAICEQGEGQPQAAYADMARAGDEDPSQRTAQYWQGLAGLAALADHPEAALDAYTSAIIADPAHVNDLNSGAMSQIWLEARNRGLPRESFLSALWQAGYAPSAVGDQLAAQDFWFDLFQLDANRGSDDEARQVLDKIDRPWMVIGIRADKRYRPFVKGNPNLDGATVMVTRYVDTMRKLTDAHPREISAVNELALALMQTDQLPQALKMLDDVLAKVQAAPAGTPPFDDLQADLRWTLDIRARVLARLGRWDDALAAQQAARDDAARDGNGGGTGGGDDVSQHINLGDLLYRLQRPREALAEVDRLDKNGTSPVGDMEADEVRACAAAQIGDARLLHATLAFMRKHGDDAPDALRSALECANDQTGLANMVIRRLADPNTRNDELVAVQTYLPDPNPSEYDRTMDARWKAVLARASVHAAIVRYGDIEHYPVFPESD